MFPSKNRLVQFLSSVIINTNDDSRTHLPFLFSFSGSVRPLSMQDILSVMIPGQSYTFEDICKELERSGYRVTNTDTVKDSLYKLAKKEYIILISGIYIRIDAIEDFPPTYLGAVREILSLMVPEEVYEVETIKELREDVGYEPLPKEVIKAYMDYMVKVKLLEIVARNGYRLIEQNE